MAKAEREKPTQQVVVVVRRHPSEVDDRFTTRVEELVGLCEAAGGAVAAQVVQTRQTPDAALYIGTGKVEEVRLAVEANDADVVVFDDELSPGQVRNLESRLPCRVIDRTQLILDIFALRARSREGMLQVEIAQLQYLLPRLTGRGAELSRLGGGIGTRGPGESKLEMDRRRIRERISHLRERLKALEGRRSVQRNRRARSTPTVALVGYTNAGKTTLLRRWTQDRGSVPVATGHNRLFDTLDPLARRVKSGATGEIVVLDTVGFVQNLPHLLVDAFRATLEEATAVDLIVHVVDATSTSQEKMATTYKVLEELEALGRPVITLFNKADVLPEGASPPPDVRAFASIYASAETGMNMEAFYQLVDEHLGMDTVRLSVSSEHGDVDGLWSHLARVGRIVTVGEEPTMVQLDVERRVAERTRQQLLGWYPDLTVRIESGQEGANYDRP
ncbi:GTPase HflX [Alicyclobacillus mengziensis]|uniref:GTPase HflX n=1 Tax=Alicyclobacillus mengziensis TaxID=2931921 RepID=A0A9X7VVX6_9BACL|nr:GTPase HflX [Alicyclobacillus mengziensis]QSO45507.1 GTPase HflX [Alicyclobacillus mengziensis]